MDIEVFLARNLPLDPYKNMMATLLGKNWTDWFNIPYNLSMGIMTVYVMLGIAKSLSEYYKIDSLATQIMSFVALFILTPVTTTFLPMDNLSASGLFLGMFVTIGTVEIMRWVLSRGWKIRMPDSVPENVSRSFEALIPGLFVFVIFDVIRFIFTVIPFDSAQAFIFKFLQTPLTSLGASYPATLVIEVFATILFSFGLHGPNIIGGVMNPIWLSLTTQNAAAYAAGKALPNIVNGQFDANYVKLGGCGCTIGLAIIAAFMAKSDQYKTLGRLGIVPGFFNINEPLIFGIPIVLNPIMMIPFILSPVIFVSLSYFVMKIGLVPIANGVNIPWTTPPIIAGFLISGWKGALFQLVEIVVSMAWWYPFFKIVDKQVLEQEQKQA